MLALLWNISAAIRGYLRFYMPTNRVLDWVRSPRGLKWAIPVAVVATPAYLFATSICATTIVRGAPGYLNVLVLLFAWNAIKFGFAAALSPFWWLAARLPHASGRPSSYKRAN